MTPEELLKQGESFAKGLDRLKNAYEAAKGPAKELAKAKYERLEAAIKATGKKASSSMTQLKKAGEVGGTIQRFFANPFKILEEDGLKEIKGAISTIGGAMKKGYDFSRGMDDKLYDAAKKYAPEIAAGVANMTGPVAGAIGGAAVRTGRKVEKAAKDADVAETKKLIADQRKQKGLKEVEKQTKSAGKTKSPYAKALEKDKKLPEYIKQRNSSKKGTAEYNRAQNKINAAYGKGPARDIKLTKEETEKLKNINFTGKGSLKSQQEAANKKADDKTANKKGKKTSEEIKKSLESQVKGMRAITKRG